MSTEYNIEVITKYIHLSPYDFIAFIFFLFGWVGYNWLMDNFMRSSRGLSARMHLFRVQWMITTLQRENRVVDTNVIQNYQSSISFLASTSILIIAGLLAMLSSSATAIAIIKQIPFSMPAPKIVWYLKNFLLIYLFIYAFFKLTWALRQLNYCIIMIGALPLTKDPAKTQEYAPSARRTAMVATMAARDMNRGIRAYYFAIAVLAWFINPFLLMISTAWVMIVLYRREFKSSILHVLALPARTNSILSSQTPKPSPSSQ